MSEIKSSIPKEDIEKWMEDNNLTVANNFQLCAKLMELEERLNTITEYK